MDARGGGPGVEASGGEPGVDAADERPAAGPDHPTGPAGADRPAPSFERLDRDLYRFTDTCHVHVLRSGREATLIDFGSGAVLDALHEIGVDRVNAVLMTHHHRDQAQGLTRERASGLPVWVPHAEQDLFAAVDEHWGAREVLNSYNNRQDRFSLLRSVPVAGTLEDYARLEFGGRTFEVVPTPGHTTGSITLLCDVDGDGGPVRLAFVGDLIAAPGKVWSLAATQWSYNGAEGVAAGVASLLDLRDRRPDLLLPSHGESMREPDTAIDALTERLLRLLRERRENPRLLSLRERPYEALTPHLLRNRTSLAYGYVLLSRSGKALFLDFGYDFMTGQAAGSDRASRRPWLYTLPSLKRDHGVSAVDVVVPTHFHDDHVAGLNLLRDVEGARVWAAENFADILERPEGYDLPCLWYDPIPVDRRLPLDAPVEWEEYVLTLHAQPGHTRYAVAVSFEVDDRRVLAIGDQYVGGAEAQWNYVYANDFASDDYRASAALYRRLRPDLILSGHADPYWVEDGYLETLERRGDTLARLHRELLPDERLDPGAPERSARLDPYATTVARGASLRLDLRVRNPSPTEERASATLVVPDGWRVEPERHDVSLPGRGEVTVPFDVTPAHGPVRRARVAADLTVGGRPIGQAAEALVTVL